MIGNKPLLKRIASIFPTERVRGLLGDSAWQFGEAAFRMVISMLVGALVARHLSITGYGVLNYSIAVVALMLPLARFGMDSIVTREIAISPSVTALLVPRVVRLTFFTGLLSSLIVAIFAFGGNHSPVLTACLALISLAGLSTPLGIYNGVLKAHYLSGIVAKNRAILAAIFGIARVAMVYSNASVIGFVLLIIIEDVSQSAICYFICKRHNLLTDSADQNDDATALSNGELITQGFPLMLSFLLITIYSKLDLLMLEHLRSIQDTGVFAAATKLSELCHIIPGILVGTFLPHFAQMRETEPDRFLRTIRIFAACFFWGSLAVIGLMWLLSTFLIHTLFGDQFSEAAPILRTHILSFTAVCLGGLISYWYIIEKLQKFLIIASTIGLISNLILNYLWIPKYGGNGSAAATAISYTLSVIVPPLLFSRIRPKLVTLLQGICFRFH